MIAERDWSTIGIAALIWALGIVLFWRACARARAIEESEAEGSDGPR